MLLPYYWSQMSAEMAFGGPFNNLLVSVVNHMMLNFIISKMLSIMSQVWDKEKIWVPMVLKQHEKKTFQQTVRSMVNKLSGGLSQVTF